MLTTGLRGRTRSGRESDMVLPYAELMKLECGFSYRWDERDVMLYALGLGMPGDPLDQRELAYVYEKNLSVLPTFFSMGVLSNSPIAHAGLNYNKVLHAEQAVTMHKPAPTSGEARVKSRMIGAWDKGVDKGAVFRDQSDLYLVGDDEPFATVTNTAFGRAEGGLGGGSGRQPAPHPIPDRMPDKVLILPTLRQQALIYRQVSNDLNPLHVDPDAARAAGFHEPILHGLCTFGICQRAILSQFTGFEPDRLKHIEARFTGIVYPGESLRIEAWRDGETVAFQAFAIERETKVIGNGKAVIA
ncbi:MAG: MaoC/PaaZ C-terminal domain-containing protein [Sphingobium sp.]